MITKELKLKFEDLTEIKKETIKIFENNPPKSKFPKKFNSIFDFEPIEVARQLTIISSKNYHKIEKIELISAKWTKKTEESPNISNMMVFFNNLGSFIQSKILDELDLKKRAKIYAFFIDVAVELKKLSELNLVFSCFSGLNSAAIHRLKFTKNLINSKKLKQFKEIEELQSTDRNYMNLRDFNNSIQGPNIPYLGIYLTDLIFIEDGNASYAPYTNWNKRKLKKNTIESMLKSQNEYYNLVIHEELQKFILQEIIEKDFGDDEFYKKSLIVEPRNKKK